MNNQLTKSQAWIQVFNFRTIPLSISGIIMGSAIAFHHQATNWTIFGLALITAMLFQTLSNIANDYGDWVKGTDNEERLGPIRGLQSGAISIKEMKIGIVLVACISCLSSIALIYVASMNMPVSVLWTYGILTLACIIAAIGYTVGKRAYGYYGLGDPMVLVFFGWVSVLGVYSLYTKNFDWNNLMPATAVGFLSIGVLNLNNMRDYFTDQKANKMTIAIKLGQNGAKIYHILLILSAICLLSFFFLQQEQILFFLTFSPIGMLLILHLLKVAKTRHVKEFDSQLKVISMSTFAISLIYFLCIVL